MEGPKSGGHQGAKYDELFAPEHQPSEAILPPIKEERDKWGNFPIIAAGGIWDRNDIEKIMDLGRWYRWGQDSSEHMNVMRVLYLNRFYNAKEEDIVIVSSPVGYPEGQ